MALFILRSTQSVFCCQEVLYHWKKKLRVSVKIAHCGEGPVIINSIETLAQHAFLSDYEHLKGLHSQAGEQKQGCYEGIYHYTTSQGQIQGRQTKYAANKKHSKITCHANLPWA